VPNDPSDRLTNLVPQPLTVRVQPGKFKLTAATPVTGEPTAAAVVRDVLAAIPWPGEMRPGEVRPGEVRPGDASPGEPASPGTPAGEIAVEADAGLPPEGYRLLIGPEHIRVAVRDPAGAYYAAQTIRQLLPEGTWRAAVTANAAVTVNAVTVNAGTGTGVWADVGCAEIEDAPALAWRGAHLDVARHFFPKYTVLRFIDLLAAHKLNRLHLHLTDDQGWRIESGRYPQLQQTGSHRPSTQVGRDRQTQDGIPHGGYYTLADLAEIGAYAARHMITVVPELEVPGHARAFLAALPDLAAAPQARPHTVATTWGIFPDIMSPLPEVLDVLGELFGELLTAVPAPYVHIGGDECVLTDWAADPRIVAYQRDLGLPSPEALYNYFLRQVADMLADQHHARAIVWDEGFSGGELRPDTVVMAWHGMDVARQAAEAGHDVVATPMLPTYFDYAQSRDDGEPAAFPALVRLEDVAAFEPVPADWPPAAAGRLLGAQFQLWSEYIKDGRALDYMTFPRACAFADVAWSGRPSALPAEPRLAAHLGRLAAAGVEYRPPSGPLPWQQAGRS
jgi:hexosaminidase